MNTNIKKKGRIAMAWLVIVTMVFATMSAPFALAKPVVPPQPSPDTPGVTFDLDTFVKPDVDSEEDGYVTYRITDEADFIIFKQGSDNSTQTSYLWTPISIDTTLQGDIVEQLVYWANYYPGDKDGSLKNLKLSDLDYMWGFGLSKGIYGYSILHDEVNNEFVIVVAEGTLSHITFGSYDEDTMSDSAQIVLNKVFLDEEEELIPLEGGEFEFDLYESDEDWTMGEKVFDESFFNDMDGKITFPAFTYDESDIDNDEMMKTEYYLAKEVIPGELAEGVTYDEDPIKIMVTIELNDEEQLEATISIIGEKEVFTNTYKEEEEVGAIEVIKEIQRPAEEADLPVTKDFYVALFENDTDTEPISAVKVINIVASVQTNEVIFGDLEIGKTYFVFETDPTGVKIATEDDGTIIRPVPAYAEEYFAPEWLRVNYEDEEILVTAETQIATIINYFDPNGEGLTGSIEVIKKVTVNNKPVTSAQQFHVGLFKDEGLQTLIEEKLLVMGTKTSFDNLEAGGIYFVAETDGSGHALTKEVAKALGFDIAINDKNVNSVSVTITGDETVNIVNNFTKEEFPLTGDDSNTSLWLFLAMLGVAGAIAPFAFRKKEVAND